MNFNFTFNSFFGTIHRNVLNFADLTTGMCRSDESRDELIALQEATAVANPTAASAAEPLETGSKNVPVFRPLEVADRFPDCGWLAAAILPSAKPWFRAELRHGSPLLGAEPSRRPRHIA